MSLPETDLALESVQTHEKYTDKNGIAISRSANGSQKAISIHTGSVQTVSRAEKSRISHALSNAINELLPSDFCISNAPVTVICLGNASLTPDSLGPATASKILATRHLQIGDKPLFDILGGREITVLKTGTAGETGIESAEIAKMCVSTLLSSLVITVDALKASRAENLLSVIQVSEGVAPGSGVGSRRTKISEDTLGVPVISVGVPTVISAKALLGIGQKDSSIAPATAKTEIFAPHGDLLVTTLECDIAIKIFAEIISNAINISLLGDAAELI